MIVAGTSTRCHGLNGSFRRRRRSPATLGIGAGAGSVLARSTVLTGAPPATVLTPRASGTTLMTGSR